MSNLNLNPVVLIPGLTGSRLVTKGRYFPNPTVPLWINLVMMGLAGETGTDTEEENLDLESVPEVVADVPPYKIDPKAARSPDPWWKEQMQLDNDGITPIKNGDDNRAARGLKAISKVVSDLTPDFSKGQDGNIRDNRYFKPLIEAFQSKGYSEKTDDSSEGNLLGAPYDWRTSPQGMSIRYDYFNWLKGQVEQMYDSNGQKPVVIVAHSMGNRVTQYFLQWVKNSHEEEEGWGQAWIDKYIERYIAAAPPYLGAPMSVRLTSSNEVVKLASVAISGMREILQSFSFIPWLLPLPEAEREEYFNTRHFVFLEKDGSTDPLDIPAALTQAGAENSTLKFIEEYKNDSYFSGEEKEYGNKGVECPPVAKLDVIYAPGTPTEVGAYYTKASGELEVQKINKEEGSFVVKDGLILETADKTTQKIDGEKNSGDGVVPYASMVYFKKWQADPSVKTTINGHPLVYTDAVDVAGHDRVVKDQKGIDKILSLLGL